MWFKNLRVYRLTRAIDLDENRLQSALAERAFAPCTKVDFSRFGWVPPLGGAGEMLTHTVSQYTMICARRQEKILPTAAINELLEEKRQVFEAEEARPLRAREKTAMKEDIIQSLLPRALTRSALTYAYFDSKRNLLYIDSASATKAEEFLDVLRATLGELPVVPLSCHGDAADIMTRWIVNAPPGNFELDSDCELKASRDASNVVRVRNQELHSEEITQHIRSGKRATQLTLNWRAAVQLTLADDFAIKRLRFEDKIHELANGESDDDAATRFDQEFAVMTIQLDQMVDELVSELGGFASESKDPEPAAA